MAPLTLSEKTRYSHARKSRKMPVMGMAPCQEKGENGIYRGMVQARNFSDSQKWTRRSGVNGVPA